MITEFTKRGRAGNGTAENQSGEKCAVFKMPCVLWIIDHLGHKGFFHGAGVYCFNTISRLQDKSFDVTLCVLRKKDGLTDFFSAGGIEVHHLNRRKFDPVTILDIIGLIRRKRIGLIHAHGYGASNFARICGIFCRIPVIIHSHDADQNYPWYQKLADTLLKDQMSGVIAVSEFIKSSCVAKRSIRPESVRVLANGIQLEAFLSIDEGRVKNLRKHFNLTENCRVVGAVGRLSSEKGVKYLLEAFPVVLRSVPDSILVVAGTGPLQKELLEHAQKLGIGGKVFFIGFCWDVPSFLSLCNVVAIPSLSEGSPFVLLESMAMGRPIVATSIDAIKEVLKNGETGLLVPPKEPEPLAAGIVRLLTHMDESRIMGENARRHSQNYTVDEHVRSLTAIYETVLNKNPGSCNV